MTSSAGGRPPYLVRTTELPDAALRHLVHPMGSANRRHTLSLGDSAGLTKTGVHFCRLAPGATSTTLHYHTCDDEWYYIIEAGADAALLLWEPREGEGAEEARARGPREETIKAGDFLGFKGGVALAHGLKGGSEGVVYLVGGSREVADNSIYPLLGSRILTDRSKGGVQAWSVQEENLKVVNIPPPRVAP
ncbi:hypothetical protein C8Q79DRAFT_963944 [Trametes meyenii]|nr:hypothetical protein C8Q79DRAFT_963944 [Trametes meyenii]